MVPVKVIVTISFGEKLFELKVTLEPDVELREESQEHSPLFAVLIHGTEQDHNNIMEPLILSGSKNIFNINLKKLSILYLLNIENQVQQFCQLQLACYHPLYSFEDH